LLLIPTVLLCHLASAQVWPLPANTQNTQVICSNCFPPNRGLPTIGYSGAIKSFVGRYVDSTVTRDYQETFRTVRAHAIRFAPERNRVYMILGSALAAYKIDSFFKRENSRKALTPSTAAPVMPPNSRTGAPELYLNWDKFFYAENTNSGWTTPFTDGQDRLYAFDWDDRGYVYIGTSSYFGWGIVFDDGNEDGRLMKTVHQEYPPDQAYPGTSVISVKSNGRYYLLVPGAVGAAVWDVTDPTKPVRQQDISVSIGSYAKLSGNRIAIISTGQVLAVYSVDSLIVDGQPLNVYATTDKGGFRDVTTDGTNLFAISSNAGAGVLTVFAPSQAGGFTPTRNQLPVVPANVNYGAGYLSVLDLFSDDVRLFKLDSALTPIERSSNGYIGAYYSSSGSQSYAHPDFTSVVGAYPYQWKSSVYLVVAASGLGDVYLLEGNPTRAMTTNECASQECESTDPRSSDEGRSR
jgi:hypothetical protein